MASVLAASTPLSQILDTPLSHVRTLGGLALLNFEPTKVKANKRVHQEMERLTGLQSRTLQSHCIDSGGSSQVEEMEVEE